MEHFLLSAHFSSYLLPYPQAVDEDSHQSASSAKKTGITSKYINYLKRQPRTRKKSEKEEKINSEKKRGKS